MLFKTFKYKRRDYWIRIFSQFLLFVITLSTIRILSLPVPDDQPNDGNNRTNSEKAPKTRSQSEDWDYIRLPVHKPDIRCNNRTNYIILIHSAISHWNRRQVIRRTWGLNQPIVFVLGQRSINSINTLINRESLEFDDIVQGSFIDTYRNLSLKHVAGLRWASDRYPCQSIDYVVKIDDDVFVNVPQLQRFLKILDQDSYRNRSILCDVVRDALVKRSYRSKWRISYLEYRFTTYPTYCNGWGIIYRSRVIPTILRGIDSVPFLWVDDVYVTGLLARYARVEPSQIDIDLLALDWDDRLIGNKDLIMKFNQTIFGPPQLNIKQMRILWKLINEK